MQGSIQEALPPDYETASAPLNPQDYIRLDTTRVTFVRNSDGSIAIDPKGQQIRTHAYSTIEASERTPEDPFFLVRFIQDSLPFDANGNLVPDDGRRTTFVAPGPEGKPITYHPLWTDAMRKVLDKKMKRINAAARTKAPAEDDIEDDVNAREVESELVNPKDWLMGDAEYPFFLVQAAVKKRWGVSLRDAAEIVRFLVLEEQLIGKDDVAPKFKRYLVTSI